MYKTLLASIYNHSFPVAQDGHVSRKEREKVGEVITVYTQPNSSRRGGRCKHMAIAREPDLNFKQHPVKLAALDWERSFPVVSGFRVVDRDPYRTQKLFRTVPGKVTGLPDHSVSSIVGTVRVAYNYTVRKVFII